MRPFNTRPASQSLITQRPGCTGIGLTSIRAHRRNLNKLQRRTSTRVTAMAPNVINPGGGDDSSASLPFISRRSPVLGKRGMVACSQPLAAEVGHDCDFRQNFTLLSQRSTQHVRMHKWHRVLQAGVLVCMRRRACGSCSRAAMRRMQRLRWRQPSMSQSHARQVGSDTLCVADAACSLPQSAFNWISDQPQFAETPQYATIWLAIIDVESFAGIGGDAFALYWDAKAGKMRCLMGNGRSPGELTMDAVRALGIKGSALPPFHAVTVTVPGAAAAWEDAVKQWGTLPLSQVMLAVIQRVCWPESQAAAACSARWASAAA